MLSRYHYLIFLHLFLVGLKIYFSRRKNRINNQTQLQPNELLNIAEIKPLSPEDAVLDYGQLGNFSLAGFEMVLTRYVSTYIITYYLPSGKLL